MITQKAFAGLSVMTVPGFPQLLPVSWKLTFSRLFDKYCMKHLLGSQLWHLFQYAELTEVVRQNDKLLIYFLNQVWISNIDL